MALPALKRGRVILSHLQPQSVGSRWLNDGTSDEIWDPVQRKPGQWPDEQQDLLEGIGIVHADAERVGITFEYVDSVAVPSRRRVKVQWHDPLRRVLLVKKWRSEQVRIKAAEIAGWLAAQGISILVESADLPDYNCIPGVTALPTCEGPKAAVDLVVSIGGDGTLLHASRLFRFLERCVNQLLPPCLVLGMGSLGFLATVSASDWEPALKSILFGNVAPVPCTLRTRLRCYLKSPDGKCLSAWYALNECVVLSRGAAIGKLRLSVDGSFVTLVEGDGIIVSTPTGSTGYSLSCGGPIVSPSMPGTLLTPIAPASLSFRPVLISELSTVEILLPQGARSDGASVVLDGREMGKLERGSKVVITVARPLPVLNVAGLDKDWFHAITTKLKWNVRDVEQEDIDR